MQSPGWCAPLRDDRGAVTLPALDAAAAEFRAHTQPKNRNEGLRDLCGAVPREFECLRNHRLLLSCLPPHGGYRLVQLLLVRAPRRLHERTAICKGHIMRGAGCNLPPGFRRDSFDIRSPACPRLDAPDALPPVWPRE